MATLPPYSPSDRFWSLVNFGDGTGCWEWAGSLNGPNRYGKFGLNGKTVHAHRQVWVIVHGSIPDGLHVLHHCDNKKCVRPDHLFLGTQKDNVQDMIRKGGRTGTTNTKITEDDVLKMRTMMKDGYTQREVAERFGIDRSFVSKILRGKRWGRVA